MSSGFGDLVRAIGVLGLEDGDTAARVARMLGVLDRAPAPRRPGPAPAAMPEATAGTRPGREPATTGRAALRLPPDAGPSQSPVEPEPADEEVAEISGGAAAEAVAVAMPHRAVPASVTLLRRRPPAPDVPPGPPAEPVDLTSITTEYLPPWRASWAPGIAFAAAATRVDLHRLDVAAVVRALAGGHRPVRLPTRSRLSGRRGVQLLLDHGDAMRPFLADREWVRGLVTQAVGTGRTETVHFRDHLEGRVATGPPLREHPAYRPPQPGVPILIFSDLGRLGISRQTRGWGDFLVRTVPAHPVTLITPCAPGDYPEAVRRSVLIVPLDPAVRLRKVVDARDRHR